MIGEFRVRESVFAKVPGGERIMRDDFRCLRGDDEDK